MSDPAPADAPSTSPREDAVVAAATEDAERIVGHFADEPTAMAAVLLARDRGHGVEQIVEAGTTGRLQADGQVTGEDGGAVQPDEPATELFVDDRALQPVGFRSVARSLRREPISISEFVARAGAYGETHGYPGLGLILMAMESGYSVEQLVTQVLSGGGIGFVEVGPDDSLALAFYGDDGSIIAPSPPAPPTDTPVDADESSDDASTPDGPETEPDGSADSGSSNTPSGDATDLDQAAAKLIERAVGVYPITADLGQHLEGLGDVISLTPPEGEFVVEPDGTVRGSLVYTIQQGYEGEVTLTTLWDRTFQEADLVVLDDGLTFETDVMLVISWNGEDPTEYTEVATGLVDVDIGQIVITGLTELDSVRFEKQADG